MDGYVNPHPKKLRGFSAPCVKAAVKGCCGRPQSEVLRQGRSQRMILGLGSTKPTRYGVRRVKKRGTR